MPVQRLYSLPHCTLLLEGLSNSSSFDNMGRQSLDILIRFECRLLGQPHTLVGGRDLLESLARATSATVQSWISGVQQRQVTRSGDGAGVHLVTVDDNSFKLMVPNSLLMATVTPGMVSSGTAPSATADTTPNGFLEMQLPLVQVFDLVEALDQLAADSQTLASLEWQPRPLSRQLAVNRKSASQQALPFSLATGGLAAAAAVLFMVPVPRVLPRPEPKPPTPQETLSPNRGGTAPTPGAAPTPGTPTSAPMNP